MLKIEINTYFIIKFKSFNLHSKANRSKSILMAFIDLYKASTKEVKKR